MKFCATVSKSGSEMNAKTGDPTSKVWLLDVTESIRNETRNSFLSLQSKVSLVLVTIGSEVTVAKPETTAFDLLACAIGPETNGKTRTMAIAEPRKTPSKIIDSKILKSTFSLEKFRRNTRVTNINAPHIATSQTGLANPTEVITIAADNQVASASELSRKST